MMRAESIVKSMVNSEAFECFNTLFRVSFTQRKRLRLLSPVSSAGSIWSGVIILQLIVVFSKYSNVYDRIYETRLSILSLPLFILQIMAFILFNTSSAE